MVPRLVGVCLATALLGHAIAAPARAVQSVSPGGTKVVEGNTLVFPFNNPYPADPPVPSPGFRFQELHPTAFDSKGPGPFTITSMAWRPDVSVDGPISATWDIIALNLSTTQVEPGSMSLTFADNYGPDGATTVFSGTTDFDTDGAPTHGRLPHDFDYVFEFDTPYSYDPADGNLLFEVMANVDVTSPWIWADAANESQFTIAFAPDADVAVVSGPFITVTQFTAAGLPPGVDDNPAFDNPGLGGELPPGLRDNPVLRSLQAVPEPTSFALLLFACTICVVKKRR